MWVTVGEEDMFRGLNAINLDAKGRITIPSQYRASIMDEANGAMVLTIDTEDRCLLLYPATEWQDIEDKLANLPSLNPSTRRLQRLLIGHATDLELDSHGRILLPPLLREYAGLSKTIMLVGQGNKFEVWGEQQWHLGRDAWLADGVEGETSVPLELETLSI